MPTWLDMIKLEVENLESGASKDPASQEPDRDSEEVLATIEEPELKKLYTLAQQWERSAMEFAVKARFTTEQDELKELADKIQQLKRKSELLKEVFWVSVRDTHELWGRGGIYLRKGWKVVEGKSDMPNIMDILGGLFGR